MSQYDDHSTFPMAAAKNTPASGSRTSSEDPLVELARIVNKNKRAAQVKVEPKALDETVRHEQYLAEQLEGVTTPEVRVTPLATPEPVAVPEPVMDNFGAEADFAAVQGVEQDNFDAPPEFGEPENGLSDSGLVDSLELELQQEMARSRLDQSVSLDLEQSLVNELASELGEREDSHYGYEDLSDYAGQAVEEPQGLTEPEPYYAVQEDHQEEPYVLQEQEIEPVPAFESSRLPLEASGKLEQELTSALQAEVPYETPSVSVSAGHEGYAPEINVVESQPVRAASKTGAVDDLFANLDFAGLDNSAGSASVPEESAAEPAFDTDEYRVSDSDFDTIFADVVPERHAVTHQDNAETGADHIQQQDEIALSDNGLRLGTAETDIDDMAWPHAASAVPDMGYDEDLPPPPGGYDLDAVARAMQESDPRIGHEGVLPEHSHEMQEAVPEASGGGRKGLIAAGAVLAVALLGGGYFMLSGGDDVVIPDGEPPVIAGLEGPFKVYPEAKGESKSSGSKPIYDRVGGVSDTSKERLVVPEKTTPAELPPAPANTAGDLAPGAPKKVRTLVVRPDGTVVQGAPSSVRTIAITSPSPAQTATPTPAASSSNPVSASPANTATPVADQPAASAQQTGTQNAPSTLPRGKPDAPRTVAVQTITPQSATPATPVKQTAAPVRTTQPKRQNSGPLDLTNPASAPVASSNSIAAGTYVVQVTSQRSGSAARSTYQSLQRKYSSVLGGRQAAIVSAEIPGKGVFYRARIPTGSKNEAINLCQSLQAAGGDCFVRRQ